MPASPDRPRRRRIPFPFPLVPVAELRRGDLIHLCGSVYALVAGVHQIDDILAEGSVFDGDLARPEPGSRAWTDTVPVAHRGIAVPLTAADAAAQARSRDSALALLDRVRTGMGPVTGVDEEIDRIRGRDPAPPDPIPAWSVLLLVHVLAAHRGAAAAAGCR